MCGICGVHGPQASSDQVAIMLKHMEHRGPDGEGTWEGQEVVLGHRRLAIVDLSERGRQPMVADDAKVVICVNGEIYNYRDLRVELESLGCLFQSDCDSEVVIHAWRKWGQKCFARFNGMFAIALWDTEEAALYLVRDRMGIKPIYYWSTGGTTLFASDMRAIVAASGKQAWPISALGMMQYLTYENRFGAETMLEGVRMVEAGQLVRITAGVVTSTPYAEAVSLAAQDRPFDAAVVDFRAIFGSAIDRHLMSDVPIATYLSSGIDSGLVTAFAADRLEEGPTTFTGTFREGGWYDEGTGAAQISAAKQLRNVRVGIDARDFEVNFDELVFALEEPRMGTGALPQYMVAQEVAKTHKVVLTGHGGDELFSGYPVFKFVLLTQTFGRDWGAFMRCLRSLRLAEWPHVGYFALKAVGGSKTRPFLPTLFSAGAQKRLLRQKVSAAIESCVEDLPVESASASRQLMSQYLSDYLPGLLVVEDKISMAHSLESRTPFLDNEMVSFALGLSIETKLDAGRLKAVPRAAAQKVLPASIFDLPKRGFPNPLSSWLRGPLAPWMRERLCGSESALKLLFEPAALENLTDRYQRSWARRLRPLDEIATHRIWMLLCLESWIRQYKQRLGVDLLAPAT